MKDRILIREFLDQLGNKCVQCGQNPCRCKELCGFCNCDPCSCPAMHTEEDYSLNSLEPGEAHHDMEIEDDGTISPYELFHHFDLNDDGKVTPQEYVDHIRYHSNNPETLDHYTQLRNNSIQHVPCQNSYDSCSTHMLNNPHDIDLYLKPVMDATGTSCRQSTLQGLMDALESLVKCGLL